MSSFVISKQDYAKVGAMLGAFTEIKERYEPILYKFNFEKGRLCDWQDIQQDFLQLYQINLEAVCDQYNEEIEDTEEINQEECIKYRNHMIKLWRNRYSNPNEFEQMIFNIYNFFRSINYQIDNEELNQKAWTILGRYNNYLLEILRASKGIESDMDCWGSFNLEI